MLSHQQALLACDLVERGYRETLHEVGTVLGKLSHGDDAGVLVRLPTSEVWLVVPGTESWRDWAWNVMAWVPWGWARTVALTATAPSVSVPAQGTSGRWWAWGFLRPARAFCEQIDKLPPPDRPSKAVGHSRGAAILAIVGWGHPMIACHCFASPRVRLGGNEPASNVVTYVARDDAVCSVPPGYGHVGSIRWLREIRRRGEEHRIRWYRQRLRHP